MNSGKTKMETVNIGVKTKILLPKLMELKIQELFVKVTTKRVVVNMATNGVKLTLKMINAMRNTLKKLRNK